MKGHDNTASAARPARYVPPLRILLSIARVLLPREIEILASQSVFSQSLTVKLK